MTTTSKEYTAKSSANRAAKKAFPAEFAAELVTIEQLANDMWVYKVAPKVAPAREYSPAAQEMHDSINAKKAAAKDYMTEAKKDPNRDLTGVDKQASSKFADKIAAAKSAPIIEDINNVEAEKVDTALISRESVAKSPCNLVWAIAEQMKGQRRKDIIAACVDQGVAYYTARTQYQHWFTAQKADAAREAKKAEK